MDDLIIVLLCVAPFGWSWAFRRSMLRNKPRLAAIGMSMAFCFFAFGRVVIHGELVRMLPPWIPERSLLIYATGALDLVTLDFLNQANAGSLETQPLIERMGLYQGKIARNFA